MDNSLFHILAEKYLDGTASEKERRLVEGYYDLLSAGKLSGISEEMKSKLRHEIYENIQAALTTAPVIPLHRRKAFRWSVAASVALLLATGAWFLFSKDRQRLPIAENPEAPVEIAAGSNKAILTLADDRQIVLDSASGRITTEDGVTVMNQDGQLAYSGTANAVQYNTITVPRRGQYQLVLADGSKVWLDAESSLRYPTSFTGNDRIVELTGQGYFEVSPDPAKPFHVKTTLQDVTVLGTHFNINSYATEDAVRTTLLEGRVRIQSIVGSGESRVDGQQSIVLKPGQQAVLGQGALRLVQGADLEQVMAWKNGQFSFKHTSLEAIMNQVMRWYDVEVVYEGKQAISLSGYVDRNVPLSQTLKLLESNGVRLRQEGRKIIMMP